MLHLSNNEIDRQKWDECVVGAADELIYARSFYLDRIAPGWKALAGDDYEWILPLTAKTKFGITYLYQPPFTQQLGVFAKPGVLIPYQDIIQYVLKQYAFCEVSFNYLTPPNIAAPSVHITTATNFTLNLSGSYSTICGNYHGDLIKNLKKSRRHQHIYKSSENYMKYVEMFRQSYGSRIGHVKDTDYNNFKAICDFAKNNNMLVCREITNQHQVPTAAALMLFDGKRLYNLMNTTTALGRRTAANHFLMDAVIKEFSGRDVLFDFEGSDLPGVKTFYENFGAVNQPFYHLRYNRLPWPLRLLKK